MNERLSPRQQRILSDLIGKVGGLQKQVGNLERAQHARLTTIHAGDGTGIQVVGDDDKVVSRIGGKSALDGEPVQYVDGPEPSKPATPVVESDEPGLVRVELVDTPPADLRVCRVLASLEPGNAGAPVGSIWPDEDVTIVSVAAGVWHVRLQWVTKAGKESELSEPVTVEVEPPVDAQDLQDTLDAAQERLDEYRDNVAAPRFQSLEQGLSESNDSLENARTRLSAAESTLAPLPARIESAEQDVAVAQGEATKAAAAAVEANNRAMTRLANGNFESDLDYWDHDNVSLTSTAHSGQQAAQITGWLRPGSSFPVVADQIWELSLYHQYDVTVEFQALDGDQRATLSTHHFDGDSTWSDSGALRVTIPADVHMLSFTITGTGTIVDDITLRDVTDVVRLEEAANANRQKAEQAIAELEVLQLAVDGVGGLKDRLQSAESTLQDKADTSALDQLDQKLAGDLAAFESHYTRVWRQPTPPPPGVHYAWLGEPHASPSVMLDGDGNETARNYIYNSDFSQGSSNWIRQNGDITHTDNSVILTGVNGVASIYQGMRSRIPDVTNETPVSSTIRVRGHGEVEVRFGASGGRYIIRETIDIDEYVTLKGMGTAHGNVNIIIYYYGDDSIEVDRFQIEQAETASDYFDGDTPSDRARDLWYNQDGVPHEWVNGQGWTPISDARITELANTVSAHATRLQTAETELEEALEGPIDHERLRVGTGAFDEAFASKLITEHATIINAAMRNLSVEEKLLFAEAIGESIWADLGVFDRLQAREGWIGGTLLADGAVTAEKIHATRELITKIMGAEWAYIAEQLIVDGSILTRDLEALSAAIQSLTVTQRADIAELWADQIWSALGVFDELQAEEAWITSAMIQELTAEKVTVTQEFVARIGTFAEILGDKLWANQAFIDRMAASEAYFGSEDADQLTRLDGAGMTSLERTEDDEFIPALRVGGGDFSITFLQDGVPTGTITRDGHMSGLEANFQNYVWQGRQLFGRALQEANTPVLDSVTHSFVAANERYMLTTDGANQEEYGFLPLTFQAIAGMTYEIVVPGLRFWNTDVPQIFAKIHYTTDGRPPVLSDPFIGREAVSTTSHVGTQHQIDHFTRYYHAETDGQVNLLLTVRALSPVARWWQSGTNNANHVEMYVRPSGVTPEITGGKRDVTLQNPDLGSGDQFYYTGWTPTWHQAYVNSQKYTGTATHLLSGTNGPVQRFSTHFGGYRNSPGYAGSTGEPGLTMGQALTGAFIAHGNLTLTGAANPTASSGQVWVQWHTFLSAPDAFVSQYDTRLIQSVQVSAGQQSQIDLPRSVLDAIAAGTFQGFTLHHPTDTSPYVSVRSEQSANTRPEQPMIRLGYVR